MANTVTRDPHLLSRNLKLNDHYISNDGGNEGISIADTGITTISPYGVGVYEFGLNDFYMKHSGDRDDYLKIQLQSGGKTVISTVIY